MTEIHAITTVQINLTLAEATSLYTLLYAGTTEDTVRRLGLQDLLWNLPGALPKGDRADRPLAFHRWDEVATLKD